MTAIRSNNSASLDWFVAGHRVDLTPVALQYATKLLDDFWREQYRGGGR